VGKRGDPITRIRRDKGTSEAAERGGEGKRETWKETKEKRRRGITEERRILQSSLCLRLMGAIRHFVGVLGQTPGPAVSAAAAAAISAAVIAATEATAAVAAVIVADNVARAVMRVRDHLVGHVFLLGAEELLQADDGGDHESDLAHQQRLAGDHGDRAER